MESGIREAVGILLPFVAHQLYSWLQSAAPGAPGSADTSPLYGGEGDLLFEFDDEPLEEAQPEVAYPICPVIEGSSVQQLVRQLSYQDDGFIYLAVGSASFLPCIILGATLKLLRCCLRPLSPPRRDVVIKAARTRDPASAPPQPGRRKSH